MAKARPQHSRTETGWALTSIEPPEDTVALTSIGAKSLARGDVQGSGR